MKYPLEEKLPYMWLALAVLAIFYGIYFSKMLVQKRHGIRTHQIGRRKEKTLHTIEMLMGPRRADGSAAVHRARLELSARKRALHRLLHRNAGRFDFPSLRSVHEGQLAGGHP